VEDLSHMPLAKHALVAGSSMAAGNTVNTTAEKYAMTSPGSAPVDPLPAKEELDDPNIEDSPMDKDPRATVMERAGRGSDYSAPTLEWKECANG
jgi:hypothetical protein